jgi:hypothetical protein
MSRRGQVERAPTSATSHLECEMAKSCELTFRQAAVVAVYKTANTPFAHEAIDLLVAVYAIEAEIRPRSRVLKSARSG